MPPEDAAVIARMQHQARRRHARRRLGRTSHDRSRRPPRPLRLRARRPLPAARTAGSSCPASRRSPACPSTSCASTAATACSTAAFVSGYQGSPVGTFQEEASAAAATVPDLPIVVRPGVNEELAATVGDGQPARRLAGRQALRRRRRRLVRQGARPRPGRRRHPPRRVRRHVPPRRRDGGRRRRPGGQVVDAAELERRHARRPAHADPLPRRRAGGARPQPPRRRPVPGQRHLGRAQARHAGRRRHRHRRRPPRPGAARSCRRWSSTASCSCPTRAGGC